jgi:antitoxin CcdA
MLLRVLQCKKVALTPFILKIAPRLECALLEGIMVKRTRAALPGKRLANPSVDSKLLEDAKGLNLDLSQVFEAGLDQAIRKKLRDEWLKKNRGALDAYNAYVEKQGVFSHGLRSF